MYWAPTIGQSDTENEHHLQGGLGHKLNPSEGKEETA
jgi:hypothetical protein